MIGQQLDEALTHGAGSAQHCDRDLLFHDKPPYCGRYFV
jgi:hypothetical protein